MDVTMPDGTLVQGVPDGITQSQLLSKYQGYQAQQNNPSLASDIGKDVSGAYSNVKSDIQRGQRGEISSLGAGVEGAEDIGAGVMNLAGDVAKRIPGYDAAKQGVGNAWQGFKEGAQDAATNLENSDSPLADVYKTGATNLANNVNYASNQAAQFAQNNPDAAKIIAGVPNLIAPAYIAGGIQNAANALDKFTTPIEQSGIISGVKPTPSQAIAIKGMLPETQDMLNDRGIPDQALAVMKPADITKIKNQMYAEGISQNIQDAQRTKSGIYNMADEVGNEDIFNAENTKSQLDALHEQYSNDPQYAQSPLVKRLSNWKAMFNNDGTITPTRLNALQNQVDDAFRENPKSPDGAVYSSISAPVNNAVDMAKQQFPNWGKIISTADDAHSNLVRLTQEDNTFNGKWSPDSDKDFKTIANSSNNPADLKGDTLKQIANITNIKDEAELQKVMAFVPKDLQGQFLSDVANNAQSPFNVVRFAKGLLSAANGKVEQGVGNAAASLPTKGAVTEWDADAATHISDRMQAYKDAASQAYEDHLKNTMVAREAAPKQGAYQAATAQKSLPSPPDFTVNSVGTSSPAGNTSYASPRGAIETGVASPPPLQDYYDPAEDYNARFTPRQQRVIAQSQAMGSAINSPAGQALKNLASGKSANSLMQPIKSLQDIAPAGLGESLAREQAAQSNSEYQTMLQMGYNPAQLKAMGYKRGGSVPSPAQIEAGNYKKDHIKFQGLDISVENPKGGIRSGTDKDGKKWSVKMPAAYGYFKRTEGADGDHVDCYIGPHKKSNRIYIVDQKDLATNNFDEHKVMIGFSNKNEALNTYKSGFSDGNGSARIGRVTYMTVAELKHWLQNGNTKKPMRTA